MVLKIAATVVTWCLILAGISWLFQAPEWFWYHYIGTMPIDTYRWLDALVCVGSFFGCILLAAAGVGATVWCVVSCAKSKKPRVIPQSD